MKVHFLFALTKEGLEEGRRNCGRCRDGTARNRRLTKRGHKIGEYV